MTFLKILQKHNVNACKVQTKYCTSMYFLALSQAPPVFDAEMAIYKPKIIRD